MTEQVDTQDNQPEVPEQIATADNTELSLNDELTQAREEEGSETSVDEETDATDETAEESESTDTTDESQDTTDETEDNDQPEETEAERNQRFYELRQAQKAVKEREVGQQIDQHYQPQSADDLKQRYLDQGLDEFQAEVLARSDASEQRARMAEAREQVVTLNANLNQEAIQVIHDFPVFDPDSPEYDQAFAEKAASLYKAAAAQTVDDKSGVVVSTNIMPYQFYKDLADLRTAGLSQAQIKAQRAAEQQMAAVTPPSSTAPVAPPVSEEDKRAQALENAFNNVY